MRARCYLWNMPKHRFHKMNQQVIPCYPWLCTYKIYPGISCDILGYPWPTMLRQDCCLILPPYPFSLEDPSDMSLEDAWHARPQLFFKCLLRPSNGRPTQMPPGHVAPMTWNKAVRAVPHSDPVRCPLRSCAWTGATLSLFPSSSPVAAPQGQRVSVRNR